MSDIYGNERFYAEMPDGSGLFEPVDVWADIGLGHHQAICTAADKFFAMQIIDALIAMTKESPADERDRRGREPKATA